MSPAITRRSAWSRTWASCSWIAEKRGAKKCRSAVAPILMRVLFADGGYALATRAFAISRRVFGFSSARQKNVFHSPFCHVNGEHLFIYQAAPEFRRRIRVRQFAGEADQQSLPYPPGYIMT